MWTVAELRPAQTAEGWDAVADGYAELIDPDLGMYSQAALDRVAVGPGDRVLDVACGPGTLAVRAAERGAEVLGVDLSPELIGILERRAEARDLDTLEGRVMDGQALDLEPESFDAGFSMFGLMLFPDRAAGLEELHRVLRPDARVLISAWAHPSEIEWFSLFGEAIETALPDLPPSPDPPFLELADPERFRQELEAAGFEEVEVEPVELLFEAEGPDHEWRKLAEANPVLPAMMDRIGPEAVAEVEQAFHDLYRQRYGSGEAQMRTLAHLATGRRP